MNAIIDANPSRDPEAIEVSYVRDTYGPRIVGTFSLRSVAAVDELMTVLRALRSMLDIHEGENANE